MSTIAWFEIISRDLKAAATFYQNVLPVTLEIVDMGERTMALFPSPEHEAFTGGALVGGSEAQLRDIGYGATVVYFTVESIAACLQRVGAEAGLIVTPCTPIKGGEEGYYANFKDLEGNLVGIWSRSP
ncbi:MAG: VOC family protein [Neisseriaceae bacterium]|nr:VOC family protein [Neisseriaceae bacterium]